MVMKRKRTLKRDLQVSVLTLAMLAAAILGALWIYSTFDDFRRDMERFELQQMQAIEERIQERTQDLHQLIHYQKEQTEIRLKKELRARVHQVHQILRAIHESNVGKKSPGEIQTMMTDALRDVRFNDGRGYFFIDTLDGDVILYPVAPETEGTSIWNLKDEQGALVIQEEVRVARNEGEGFVEAYWMKPDGDPDEAYRKISFIKAFEPYGWYVGCGEYVDEVEQTIQAELLAYINEIRYGPDNENYFFVHDYQGIELANGGDPSKVGNDYWDFQDAQGTFVARRQVELATSRPLGGSFIHYWLDGDDGRQSRKMTYVMAVPEWQWVIGTGQDTEFIEQTIALYERDLRNNVRNRMGVILIVLVALISAVGALAFALVRKLENQLDAFHSYAEQASTTLYRICEEDVQYEELKDVARSINGLSGRVNRLLQFDELTEAYNRRYGTEMISEALEEGSGSFSLLLLDIDRFKQINDRWGHAAGDQILIDMVRILLDNLPPDAILVRMGGEEFVVALPGVDRAQARQLSERLRKTIASERFLNERVQITVSIGISEGRNASFEHLYAVADETMYRAKQNGRNRTEG